MILPAAALLRRDPFKLRDLVMTLKRPRAMEDLLSSLGKKDSGLCQDVNTRWNVTFFMCESAIAVRAELEDYLVTHKDLIYVMLNDGEWETVASIIKLLEPFEQAIRDFSATDRSSIHSAQENLKHLQKHLEDMTSSSEVSDRLQMQN